jgi:hypothetical protein
MPELVLRRPGLVRDADGEPFMAMVYGDQQPDGAWRGWLTFIDHEGDLILRTETETTQPDQTALTRWATGLDEPAFQQALARAEQRLAS